MIELTYSSSSFSGFVSYAFARARREDPGRGPGPPHDEVAGAGHCRSEGGRGEIERIGDRADPRGAGQGQAARMRDFSAGAGGELDTFFQQEAQVLIAP